MRTSRVVLRRVLMLAVLVLGVPAAALAAPPLIAQYHLDANDGADSSGNGINGDPGAGATVTPGRFGGALKAAGGAASLVVPGSNPNLGALRPARTTVIAWVKQSGDPGYLNYLVSGGGEGPGGCLGSPYALYTGYSGIPDGPGIRFYIRGAGGQAYFSPTSGTGVYDGQWHMVAGTFDGQRTRLYVDGTEAGPPGTESATEINYGVATDFSFRVAQYSAAGCGAPTFTGDLDEVRVYDRALSPTEIARLAAAPGPNPPDLVPDDNGPQPTPTPAPPDPLPPGGIDFTWNPNKPALVAGAPAGGVQFTSPALNGATYEWDFDHDPAQGFRPSATGPSPKRSFTADGAHDTDKVTGGEGERRRVYRVLLRVTAADGAVAERAHDLVVVPNNPPQVDFTTSRPDQSAATPVTFRPTVKDPDDTSRTADAIDHVEWDFDGTLGDPAGADLICDATGGNCRAPGGGVPEPWLVQGAAGALTISFFDRELASHGKRPVDRVDVDALGTGGVPQLSVLAKALNPTGKKYFRHDPRVVFLYDNATLLQQSTFNSDAGEATGATLQTGALRRLRAAQLRAIRRKAKASAVPVAVPSKLLRWRQITLTAVDTAGLRTSVTHSLPLTPGVAPKLRADFTVARPERQSAPIILPGQQTLPRRATSRANPTATSTVVPFPITTNSQLAFDASGSTDPDGRIAYYTLEVGTAHFPAPDCVQPQRPPQVEPGTIFDQLPPGTIDPSIVFPAADTIGTGPAAAFGAAGNIALPNLKTRPTFALRGGRAGVTPLPSLASLTGKQYVHPCQEFGKRNVITAPFTSLAGIQPEQTRAIVTHDPKRLRFKLPAGEWSVTVGAYDNSGLGAIQRTGGLKVIDATKLTCQVVGGLGLDVSLGSGVRKKLAASSQCADITPELGAFYTKQDVSLNGLVLRPADDNTAIVVDQEYGVWATRKPRPSLAGTETTVRKRMRALTGGGDLVVVVDGQPIAKLDGLTAQSFKSLLRGPRSDGTYALQPRLVDGARYNGSPISRSAPGTRGFREFHVDFTRSPDGKRAVSKTAFSIVLPKEFSTTETGSTSPTADVVREASEEITTSELNTVGFAEIAKNKKKARAAQASSSASTIDLQGMSLGPVSVDEGKMTFDPRSGLFEGSIKKATLAVGDGPGIAVSLDLVIDGGELRSASGEMKSQTGVPVFTGVTLNAVRFGIVTDPLTVKGGADFQAAKVLSGSLDLLVRPDPFLLRLDGTVSVGGEVQLGSAYVQYDASNNKNLTFGGKLGVDLGPVSARGIVDGGFSGQTGDFFVQGAVRVCLGICASGAVLVSNEALAACAEIDLGLTEVGGGFAYRFSKGLPGGLDIFTGCDLSGYRPAVFATRAGPTADARAVTDQPLVVPPGTEQIAFRFKAAPGAGAAPAITLTGPDGRTYSTRTNDYVFTAPQPVGVTGTGVSQASGALIDQDPVDKVSTFLIALPSPGAWKVSQPAGEPPAASVEFATGKHVKATDIGGDVVNADPLKGDDVRIGKTKFTDRAAPKKQAKVGRLRDVSDAAKLEDRRMRGIVITVPAGLDGKMTVVDAGPTTNQTLTEIDLQANGGKQVPLAFTPAADAGPHEIKAFLEHPDGTPRSVLTVDGYTAPAIPTPPTPRLSATELRRDRMSVIVDTGATASLSDPAARLNLVAVSPAGQRVERLITASDARRISPGRYRITLDDFDTTGKVRVFAQMVYAGKPGRVAGTIARQRG